MWVLPYGTGFHQQAMPSKSQFQLDLRASLILQQDLQPALHVSQQLLAPGQQQRGKNISLGFDAGIT